MKIPKHGMSITIEHNSHKSCYVSVAEFLKSNDSLDDFETPEQAARARDTDELWVVLWYPHTPAGNYAACGSTLRTVCGPTLREALAYACKGCETMEVET